MGGVYITSRASCCGHSPVQTNIREILHLSIIPYYLGVMTRVEYVIKTSLRLSGEASPMAILISDGVGKGDLGMVMTFCSHNQVKMEASEVLTTLHQHDSPELSAFMVRRYTNIPSFPEEPPGYSSSMWVISPRALLPNFLWTACILGTYFHIPRPRCSYPMKRVRWGIEHTPFLKRSCGNTLKRLAAPPTVERRHKQEWARMAWEGDCTFKEVWPVWQSP